MPDSYSPRYVAFIDILGFSELVEKSAKHPETFDKVLGITRGLAEVAKTVAAEYDVLIDSHDMASTAFSDSIVISTPVPAQTHRAGSLYAVAFAAQGLCRRLLAELSVATRGGIAKGLAYHKDGVLFGPAVITAYHLERDVAQVARIAVSADVAQEWASYFGAPLGLVALKDVIRADHDGVHYLDLFHFPERDSIDNSTARFFQKPGPALSQMLTDQRQNARVLRKLTWLADGYDRAPIRKRIPNCTPATVRTV